MQKDLDSWGSQLRKGVLELVVLALLTDEPRYGSQIVDDLARHPELAISAGTVYPLLARLAKAGLIRSSWQESPVGPPRKYYTLTDLGRHSLADSATTFRAVSTTVLTLLKGQK